MELSCYLAKKTLSRGQLCGKRIVVPWSNQCKASHQDISHLHSDQKEADTKQILNAIDATTSGATTIQIHSPDCRTCPYIEPIPSTLRPYSLCYWSWSERQDNPIEANLHSSWERTSSGYIRILCNADSTGCFYGKGKPNFS